MVVFIMSRIKDFPIEKYKEQFGIRIMIETGTFEGDSTRYALEHDIFPIYTCDVQKFRMKPMDESKVHFYIGKSVKCLPIMLESAPKDQPALIYLDAHCDPKLFRTYLSDIDTDDSDPVPLLEEIDVILKNRDVSRDVIIVDDMHLYVGDILGGGRLNGWSTPMPPKPFQTTKQMLRVFGTLFPNHSVNIFKTTEFTLEITPNEYIC